MRSSFVAIACLVGVIALCLGGCERKESAVLACYEAGEAAIGARDVAAYRKVQSPESIQYHEETLRIARKAGPEETKGLPCLDLERVLALRNRVPVARLKSMTVDDYLLWQMQEGFLSVDAEADVVPYKVFLHGEKAMMQYGLKVTSSSRSGARIGRRGIISGAFGSRTKIEPIPDSFVHFVRVNGVWYEDETMPNEAYDEVITEEAKEAKMGVPEYMIALEKEANGTVIPNIWAAPR